MQCDRGDDGGDGGHDHDADNGDDGGVLCSPLYSFTPHTLASTMQQTLRLVRWSTL